MTNFFASERFQHYHPTQEFRAARMVHGSRRGNRSREVSSIAKRCKAYLMRAHEGKTVRRRNARRGEGMTNNVKGTPIVKGLGFNSFGIGTNACTVDIDEEQDKILRIRPLHFDEHYTPEEMNAWKIERARKDVRARLQDADLAAVARLQEARVLQEPRAPTRCKPRGLGPARRAPSGERAAPAATCASAWDEAARPHRGRDQARA